ncbi:MAG: class I SAM-dependent rRNA methyltransferase [Anaerolineae bacterium]|nr:class I SAM-dependent rRNA methyltransferase [Anaerolineae bacterium]
MSEGIITLKKGREKPILQQHPWIFSGAIASAQAADPGDIVTVVSHDGRFLARGYWNQKSQIQVRILTWQDEPIDEDWWRRMLKRAAEARSLQHVTFEQGDNPQAAYRMINAENDFLPGLIVDRYADWLVLQALTLGIDKRKHMLADILASLVKASGIYERSDVDVRGKEGLKSETGILWGEIPPEHIVIHEHFVQIKVDVRNGHKTGFYLDQAPNRHRLYNFITEDFDEGFCQVLNLFSYTGGFGLHALGAGGVRVVNIDASMEALKLAEENVALNQLQGEVEYLQADVFEYLRDAVERNEQFDIIVCDPPKFASNKQQVERAARGYKDLNLHCFKLIKPGGYLMTFSCSGAISPDLFQKIVFGALADSGRQAQIIQHLGPGGDHPVALTFPEGAYLKGLLLRVY